MAKTYHAKGYPPLWKVGGSITYLDKGMTTYTYTTTGRPEKGVAVKTATGYLLVHAQKFEEARERAARIIPQIYHETHVLSVTFDNTHLATPLEIASKHEGFHGLEKIV